MTVHIDNESPEPAAVLSDCSIGAEADGAAACPECFQGSASRFKLVDPVPELWTLSPR